MPRNAPIVFANAGAMTSANRIGVTSGTSNSRGVWALRAKRRRDSAPKAVVRATGRAGAGVGAGTTTVPAVVATDMRCSPCGLGRGRKVRSGGQAVAGELEVDVVERRHPRRDRRGGHALVVERGHDLRRRGAVQRDGDGGADREGVGPCHLTT